MWDVETREELHRFTSYTAFVPDHAVCPDGRTAFSVSLADSLIQCEITDLHLDEPIKWVHDNCYLREFKCDEWAQYHVEMLCE